MCYQLLFFITVDAIIGVVVTSSLPLGMTMLVVTPCLAPPPDGHVPGGRRHLSSDVEEAMGDRHAEARNLSSGSGNATVSYGYTNVL